MYYNGTDWVRLAAGTSGQTLKTSGSGANPTWDTRTLSDLSDVNSSTTTAGNLLIADGTDWESVNPSGDVDVAGDGTLTIQSNSVDGTMIALSGDLQGDVMYYDGTNWVVA